MQHDDPHSQDRERDSAAHEAPHRTEDDSNSRPLRRIEASVRDLPCLPVAGTRRYYEF